MLCTTIFWNYRVSAGVPPILNAVGRPCIYFRCNLIFILHIFKLVGLLQKKNIYNHCKKMHFEKLIFLKLTEDYLKTWLTGATNFLSLQEVHKIFSKVSGIGNNLRYFCLISNIIIHNTCNSPPTTRPDESVPSTTAHNL